MTTNLTQDIKEDYDTFVTDDEGNNIFDEIDDEHSQIMDEVELIRQMSETTLAIESHGIDIGTISIMRASNLLVGTSFDAIAVESLNVHTNNSEAKELAVESLNDTIKEKETKLSARVIKTIKETGGKVLRALNPIFSKLSNLAKTITSKTWDATKATGRAIKAHPYKTIVAVIASILAVGGIIVYVGGNLPLPDSTKAQLDSFKSHISDMVNKIDWPFTKTTTSFPTQAVNRSRYVMATGDTEMFINGKWMSSGEAISNLNVGKGNSAHKLGWNSTTTNAVKSGIDKCWSQVKQGFGALEHRAYEYTRKGWGMFEKGMMETIPNKVYEATGSRQAAGFAQGFSGFVVFITVSRILWALYRLVKKIIVGGLRIIGNTLKAIFRSIIPSES
jgi:ElaB/YqjD/DUF883 family membrane-anchored ribosome-binding protein